MKHHAILLALAALALPATAALKTHGIFSSHMVLQRDKPIVIWGWADAGKDVSVSFGDQKAKATADGQSGRWEVTFPASEADAVGRKLTVTSGDETVRSFRASIILRTPFSRLCPKASVHDVA